MTWKNTKHFTFEDGSNPCDVPGERQDMIFKIVMSCDVQMIDNNNFKCTKALCASESYEDRKESLKNFAQEWQRAQSEISSSYDDLAYWGAFFTKYGTRYGLLNEFHENGIC